MYLLQHDSGDHIIFEESGLAIGDLVLEGDPQKVRDRFIGSQALPMADDRGLNPFQIAGIVDMTHEVDVGSLYADSIVVGNSS